MIYCIKGRITNIFQDSLCIDVDNSGITIIAHTPSVSKILYGESITLFTYLTWSQEQGPTLYGFITPHERHLFEILLQCQGIGPKAALATLKTLTLQELIYAVETKQYALLQKIPGIGEKKAELLILELKNLFKKHNIKINPQDNQPSPSYAYTKTIEECTEALIQLGYKNTDIQKTFALIFEKQPEKQFSLSLQDLIHESLQHL